MKKSYYVRTINDSLVGNQMVLCDTEEGPAFRPISSVPQDIITFTYKDDALDYVLRHFGDTDLNFEVLEKYTIWRKSRAHTTAN